MTTNERTPHPAEPAPRESVARVREVVETTLTLRGDGVEKPLRRVVQYWSKEGVLLAESDMYAEHERQEMLRDIRHLKAENGAYEASARRAQAATDKANVDLTAATLRIAHLEKLKKQAEQRFADLQDKGWDALKKNAPTRRPR